MATSVDNNIGVWKNDTSVGTFHTATIEHKKQNDGSHKPPDLRWKRMNSCDGDSLPLSFQRNHTNHRNNEADREEVLDYFNKKFKFEPPACGWDLPLESEMYTADKWKIEELMAMKDELNSVKNKLNDFNLDEWHKHTRAMNKAGAVLWTLKKEVEPEFATQAWCKFYEVCYSYNFVCDMAQEQCSLNSLHLCEAPGAFITSLNHYLKLNHPDLKWNWTSTTLNPYYEENPLSNMINDDRFILHTLNHWIFGHDYTGNLMDVENLRFLAKKVKETGPILLVTADGSIDCQNDPGEQELRVSQLIFCEVVSALHLLSTGGNFVTKMFTMYEQETICIMYLLVCSFKSVNVFKPATSKEGNSEVYVVCLDYVGTEEMKLWLRKLRTQYGSKRADKVMFPLSSIPQDFLDQLKLCAKQFKDYQIEVIERNIYLFKLKDNQQSIKRTKRLRYLVAEEFINRYCLRRLISIEDQIVGQSTLKNVVTPNMDPRFEQGTFNEKLEREKLPPLEKLKLMESEIQQAKLEWKYNEKIKWLQFPQSGSKFDEVITGKPVKSVHSSKFCSGRLLKVRNEVLALADEHFKYKPTANRKKDEESVEKELSSEIKGFIMEECPEVFNCQKNMTAVLNYKEKLWASLKSGKNEKHERNAFFDIMDEIDNMWRKGNLIIQGYPMLTQFTSGVIYMLGHLFEQVGFVCPNGQDFAVIFKEYRSRDHKMSNFVKKLDNQMEKLENDENRSVLSVIPLTELIGGHEEFYSCVTAVNNLCVQEQVFDIIQKLLKPPCNRGESPEN